MSGNSDGIYLKVSFSSSCMGKNLNYQVLLWEMSGSLCKAVLAISCSESQQWPKRGVREIGHCGLVAEPSQPTASFYIAVIHDKIRY